MQEKPMNEFQMLENIMNEEDNNIKLCSILVKIISNDKGIENNI